MQPVGSGGAFFNGSGELSRTSIIVAQLLSCLLGMEGTLSPWYVQLRNMTCASCVMVYVVAVRWKGGIVVYRIGWNTAEDVG